MCENREIVKKNKERKSERKREKSIVKIEEEQKE